MPAFNRRDAASLGISLRQLYGPAYVRMGKGIYAPAEEAADPFVKISAVVCRLPNTSVVSGLAAAWLHGLDVQLDGPIEVILPAATTTSRMKGLVIRRADLDASEVAVVRGIRVTTAVRTVADLASRLPLVEAVVIIDMALIPDWCISARCRRGRLPMLADAAFEI